MLRSATESDIKSLAIMRCKALGGTLEEATGWLCHVAGLQNILVLEKTENKPLAMLAIVPIEFGCHRGIWISGLASAEELPDTLLPHLIHECIKAYQSQGYEFAFAVPRSGELAGELKKLDFHAVCSRRIVQMPIERNVLATAEFDTMTVRRIYDMRQRYQTGCVNLSLEAQTEIVSRLYRQGLTIVSNRRGYALYCTEESQLHFLELQADNDHSADILLQAAREKTGVEKAVLSLSEHQSLYVGAGRKRGYGMIRFMREPFPVGDFFFPILMDRAAVL